MYNYERSAEYGISHYPVHIIVICANKMAYDCTYIDPVSLACCCSRCRCLEGCHYRACRRLLVVQELEIDKLLIVEQHVGMMHER